MQEKLWTVSTIIVIVCLSVVGTIIGLELITSLGVTPNTSIIGALVAMIIARIPGRIFFHFRSIHVQNLAQTAISAATFGAANSLLLPIAVPWAMGRPELVVPMLVGVGMALLLDGYLVYRMFNTRVFPATGAWPLGVATAGVIHAGDKGGRQGWLLLGGIGAGAIGAGIGIPMSSFGVAFLGNIWALTCFGIGLLINGYWTQLPFSLDFTYLVADGATALGTQYVPHGFMIGAGIIALVQVIMALKAKKDAAAEENDTSYADGRIPTTLGIGAVGYMIIAVIIAVITGVYSDMSTGMLIGFILYAAFAAFVHELIVGIAAMHSGWFPAFAVALITLIIGMLIGFPPMALGVLVAFSAATGPAFADNGYDFKAGFILRKGFTTEQELVGRKAQLISSMIAFCIAIFLVGFAYDSYFMRDAMPPVARTYASTIAAGTSPEIAMKLLIWAIPGAILQFIGGAKRQIGVMLATGLLIANPLAGWAVLLGILIRFVIAKKFGSKYQSDMEVFSAGVIAGDAIYNFITSMYNSAKAK
ncbi:MAG: OPT/YSL family transporter [Deferribacteraceae bacterium]|jgi:uncharacterized oligopeptide transporter (OPT) family protein|nr:OPT/YSL family transporter [Deferribacteraceae bacterium]